MIRIIKVVLPIDKPEATLKLCKKTSDKHTALGLSSPLNGFLDMVDFETQKVHFTFTEAKLPDAGMKYEVSILPEE